MALDHLFSHFTANCSLTVVSSEETVGHLEEMGKRHCMDHSVEHFLSLICEISNF